MRRHRTIFSRGWGLLLLGAAVTPLQAETEQAASLYGEALVAMRGEEYSTALELFAQAQRAGLNTSTLHYNRGVAYYKLGNYRQAKHEFLMAQKGSKSASLVHYNLGLSSYRLEQSGEARQWFQKVALESSNRQLTDLADEMVARIDEKRQTAPSPPTKKGSPWRLNADLLLGHDDNVTLENSDLAQVSSLQDNYLDLYASARYQLTGDRTSGLWGHMTASSLQYRQYDAYNYTQYDLGLFKDGRFGPLDGRAGVRVSRSEIGTRDYLQKYLLRLQGGYPVSDTHTLRARYDFSRYDPIDNRYYYLAGYKGRLNIESLWHQNGRRYSLSYELENNNRDDYRSGSNFISYSATRHQIAGYASLPVAERWQINIGADYRKSRYNDPDIISAVTSLRRKDERWRSNLGAQFRVNRYFDVVAEYHYTHNDSNVISRQYRRNQYALGVRGYF